MNKFSFVVLVSAAVVITVNGAAEVFQPEALRNTVGLSEPYEIVKKQGKTLYSELGHIPNRNCGGAGRVLQYRTEGCSTYSASGACVFPAGRNFRGELAFVPSLNTESLGVRTIMNVPGNKQVAWQNPFVSKGEPIEAGREYALIGAGALGPELRGKMITSKVEIYRESDKVVEACVEADILVV